MDPAGSSSAKLSRSSSKSLRDGSSLEQPALGALLTHGGLTGTWMGSVQFANESHVANEQRPGAVGHSASSGDVGMS